MAYDPFAPGAWTNRVDSLETNHRPSPRTIRTAAKRSFRKQQR